VEFVESPTGVGQAEILFVDQETRKSPDMSRLLQLVGEPGRVVVIGDSIEDDDLINDLLTGSVDHVVGGEDDTELVVTSAKLLTGDIFGLEKYLAWGSTIAQCHVQSYDDKRDALERVSLHAGEVGARRSVIARIANVADELLMNAIYDAPAASGEDAAARRDLGSTRCGRPAVLQLGSDGRMFGISVTDHYGALRKEIILESLLRARQSKGKPLDNKEGGAGLGLYFVLCSVSQFIAILRAGAVTEIICLFDLQKKSTRSGTWAESLHIFTDSR